MKNLINKTKKLINLRYNEFNLENYLEILQKEYHCGFQETHKDKPIRLMSGNHRSSGIVRFPSYSGAKHTQKRNIYLIGKGILFDSGGLDLKKSMGRMYDDKAGMLISLAVASYFKNDNVYAFCPISTNFIQNSLISPYDKLKIGNKIVEVTNTDAEGRLILAEAISILNASDKDIIITIATLTGACAYAVDIKATAVMGDNDNLINKYLDSAKQEKEYAWRVPLFDYMQKYYNKKVIKNSESNIKAGTSEGGMFLKQFVPNTKNYIHLDIAYSAFDKDGNSNGVPIKSLINFIKGIK